MRQSRGGIGVWTPPYKSQKYRLFSNTGMDPRKTTKLPSQHTILGHHWPSSKTPFKKCFAGGRMMAHF